MNIRSITPQDAEPLQKILEITPEFNVKDTACCSECLADFFAGGETYRFICAENYGKINGFACYGKDTIADNVIEVYWVVVAPQYRKKGIGRLLLSYIEDAAAAENARMISIETESDPTYAGTRSFYERCGYRLEASVKDFYREGDDKLIYAKRLKKPRDDGGDKPAERKDDWGSLLPAGIERPEDLPKKFGFHEEIGEVVKKFPMRVSRHYLSLIERPGDPIWKQCIPDKLELEDFGVEDPLNEEGDSPVPGLTHRYPDRVLLLVSNQCATYCRFCTRKRKVGDPAKAITMSQIQQGIQYIRENPQIRDVILSGGDPLMLSDGFLERILRDLRRIPHVQVIRIGTRVPCTLPQRVTEELCHMLKKYHPLYVNTHFNHPREVTPEAKKACEMLSDAGIPLGCQTVLLKGVNDDPEVMRALVQKLLRIRVKPYYVYQCDIARGNEHFRTPISKGIEIIENLRGHTSGMGVPQFVIDAPGGGGKIPLQPDYVIKKTKKKIVLRNYKGLTFEYPEPLFYEVEEKKKLAISIKHVE